MAKEIRIERFYPFSLPQVWDAIATSGGLESWLMPNDFRLEKDASFTFRTKPQPGFDGIVKCRVLDFRINEMLQFSWQGGPLKKPTIVKFELKAENDGTRLTLTHSGFEGFVGRYIIRFVLGNGWKALLTKNIMTYLNR